MLAAGLVQVLGGRLITAAENTLGIFDAHFLHGIDQQCLGLWHGCLGGLVHAGFQLLDLGAHAVLLHGLGGLAQVTGQLDAHLGVIVETARRAQLLDGNLGTLGQGILEATGGVFLRQVVERQGQGIGREQQARAQAGKSKGMGHEGFLSGRCNQRTWSTRIRTGCASRPSRLTPWCSVLMNSNLPSSSMRALTA
ncbi:hypothetical protein D3C80_1021710 [compost metagenome]